MNSPRLVVVGDVLSARVLIASPAPTAGQGDRAFEVRRTVGGDAARAAALLAASRREGGSAGAEQVVGRGSVVALAGVVGEDDAGRELVERLAGLGLDVEFLAVEAGLMTGTSVALAGPGAPASSLGEPAIAPAAPRDGWGLQGDPAEPAARAAVAAARPGDALLIDGGALARMPFVVDAAWERDVQIVADLATWPWTEPIDLARVDVAVVDAAGALRLAELAGPGPASVLLLTDEEASWDGEVRPAPARPAPGAPSPVAAWVDADGAWTDDPDDAFDAEEDDDEADAQDDAQDDDEDAGEPDAYALLNRRAEARDRHRAFCAGLAAALADGADRDDAVAAGWAAAATIPAAARIPLLDLDRPLDGRDPRRFGDYL